MQHHIHHGPRNITNIRAGHHHITQMHPNMTAIAPQHIMSPTNAMPQQKQQQPQQQQQLQQHTAPPTSQQPSHHQHHQHHLHFHQHQHHQTQSHHHQQRSNLNQQQRATANPMQKIRHHPHLNNNNNYNKINNNINNNNNNNNDMLKCSPYNPRTYNQQQQIQHLSPGSPQQPPLPLMSNYLPQQHNNIINRTPNYFYSKPKQINHINNNNSINNNVNKRLHRISKQPLSSSGLTTSVTKLPQIVECPTPPQSVQAEPVASAVPAAVVAALNNSNTHGNNIILTQDEIKTENVKSPEPPTTATIIPSTIQLAETSAKENLETTTLVTSDNEEHVAIGGTLPNEDKSVLCGRNSKDKTPMCLVNELARYNKITHQYRLTGERGPAHSKTFTVTLRLGEEEYSAEGFKIKKAQHLAATKAFDQTKYKHPPPKTRRNDDGTSFGRTNLTPTVELNALAMKLGQRTYYLLDPTQLAPIDPMLPPEYGAPPTIPAVVPPHIVAATPAQLNPYMRRHGNYVPPPLRVPPHTMPMGGQQRFSVGQRGGFMHKFPPQFPMNTHIIHGPHNPYGPMNTTPSTITLYVGKQKFIGTGCTLQQAKHDAAARALQMLKTQVNNTIEPDADVTIDEGDRKSPISQVHEIGIKRNMPVHFKVLREEGPAHMKNFITACIVGTIVTEGEGNGKRISKKRAAEKMLTELEKLPPLTPTKMTPVKRIRIKTPAKGMTLDGITPKKKLDKRRRNGITTKDRLAGECDDSENPITKLIILQQNRMEKEPIFEVIAKNGNENSRRREFIMEVSANGLVARGTGTSKKLAKRNAAQNLLDLLTASIADGTINSEANNNNNISLNNNNNSNSDDNTQTSYQGNITTATTTEATITTTAATSQTAEGAATTSESNLTHVPMITTDAGLMPGILILRQNKKHATKKKDFVIAIGKTSDEPTETQTATTTITTTAENIENTTSNTDAINCHLDSVNGTCAPMPIEKQHNDDTEKLIEDDNTENKAMPPNGANGYDGNAVSNNGSGNGASAGIHMKEQLLYLAKLLDFEASFSDYPKGNHKEFLTIVTLSTTPPQICHGVGMSSDESQNDAARNALKILSELGLNNAQK